MLGYDDGGNDSKAFSSSFWHFFQMNMHQYLTLDWFVLLIYVIALAMAYQG